MIGTSRRGAAVVLATLVSMAGPHAAIAFEFARTGYVGIPQNANVNRAVHSTAVGDLDGNGRDDIVVSWDGFSPTAGEAGAFFFYQRVDGTFSAPIVMPFTATAGNSYAVSAIGAGDLDGDGRAELLLQRFDGPNGKLDVLKFAGGATYSVAKTLVVPYPGWNETHVDDFDGDGKMDLLLFTLDVGSAVYQGLGNLAFRDPVSILQPQTMAGLNIADLDGNGRKDLLVAQRPIGTGKLFANFAGNPYYFFRGPKRVLLSPHYYMSGMSAGQFGGDATPELVEMHIEEEYPTPNDILLYGTIGVHRRNPDGSFTQVYNRRLGVGNSQRMNLLVATPDIDGDGDQDIVAFNADYDIHILRQTAPGEFAEPVVIDLARESAWESTYQPTPDFFDIRDFDKDGCLDIGVATMRGYEIHYRSDCAAPAAPAGQRPGIAAAR